MTLSRTTFWVAMMAVAWLTAPAAQAHPRCYRDHAGRILCTHGAYQMSPYYRSTRYHARGYGVPMSFGGYDPTLPTAHYICEPDGTNCRWEQPRGALKDY